MLKKIIITFTLILSFFSINLLTVNGNLDAKVKANPSINNVSNNRLNSINDPHFVKPTSKGAAGIKDIIINIAKEVKNLFYILATIFFLIISVRFFFSGGGEEGFGNFKKGILWISIGLFVMQISYSIAVTVFDRSVSTFASSFINNLIIPIIKLMEMSASIFFVVIGIIAFLRLVSSKGEKENVQKGINSIIYAAVGFLLVKFASKIVMLIYGNYGINKSGIINIQKNGGLSGLASMFLNLMNWVNGLIAIVTIAMIIYAGVLILLSEGDEEKLKKGRNTVIYAFIGIFILAASYGILTFFIGPGGSKI